jgi:hypothetical protein
MYGAYGTYGRLIRAAACWMQSANPAFPRESSRHAFTGGIQKVGQPGAPSNIERDVAPTRGVHGRCMCAPSPPVLGPRSSCPGPRNSEWHREGRNGTPRQTGVGHPNPTKQGSVTLSGGAKMALNHDRKVATLCHFPSPSRASGQRGPQAENRERGPGNHRRIPPSRTYQRHVRRTTPEPEKPARRCHRGG